MYEKYYNEKFAFWTQPCWHNYCWAAGQRSTCLMNGLVQKFIVSLTEKLMRAKQKVRIPPYFGFRKGKSSGTLLPL